MASRQNRKSLSISWTSPAHPLRARVRLGAILLEAAARTTVRRVRSGPMQPSWPFPVEVARTTARTVWDRFFRHYSLPEQRAFLEACVPPVPIPAVRVEAASARGVPARWVLPRTRTPARTLLYLHGGGYVIGSFRTHRELCARLARACDARVLVPEYRCAPEHRFPAAVDDALTAYRYLTVERRIPADRILVGGDSAGGGLSLALLLRLKAEGRPLPAGAVLLSPWVDLTASSATVTTNDAFDYGSRAGMLVWADAYLGGADPRTPEASPLYADLAGLPPLLVQVGTAEVLLDECRELARRAQAAGTRAVLDETPEMVHVFQAMALIVPQAREAIDRIGAFARACAP